MEKEKTEESKKHFEGTQLTDDELAAVTGGLNHVSDCRSLDKQKEACLNAVQNTEGTDGRPCEYSWISKNCVPHSRYVQR